MFQKFMIILLLVGLQSGYFGCIEPPRVREYDADVPNTYNGGLKVDQLSEGNEKMAKFLDSSRVELSLDHFTDDSYIQAYRLTNENYQNNEEQLSIDVARENRAHLDSFRVKRDAPNAPEPIKFQISEAKTPDAATVQMMRTKKELRNVRSPYEVVENPTPKSNRIGYRSKMATPRLYSGMPTHRYGLKNNYNRMVKQQPMSYRKADNPVPEFGAKLWWNPSELNRYKRLQHRMQKLAIPPPAPLILHNGIAQPNQPTLVAHPIQPAYLAQQQQPQQQPTQQQQQQYVTAYIPYQEIKSVPQPQQLYSQQQFTPINTQNYNNEYNQFAQYEKQQLQHQQFYQENPYGPVELHYDQAKTQYASDQKLDGLEVLQSLLGQDPKQQLQGLHELLSKEEEYQHQQFQQQQYQQQQQQQEQQLRPQDSTAPIVFHPSAGGQINPIAVTKSPQYQYTVAGSAKQIVPIPTSTTTFAPIPTPTTVAPTTLHYQDLLPSSTPTPFTAVTVENPLNLLPVPVQHGPESQNALLHSHQHQITSTPLPLLKSQHNENSLNSLQNHNQQQQVPQHNNSDGSSEEDDNHDVSIKAKRFYSSVVHNLVKRSALKRRPVRQPLPKIAHQQQRVPPTQVEYFFSQNPEYDFYVIPRTKKPKRRTKPTNSRHNLQQSSSERVNEDNKGEVIENYQHSYRRPEFDRNNYKTPELDRHSYKVYEPQDDESPPVKYDVVFDENDFYRNRQTILNLTEQLRRKNNEFFANINKNDNIVEESNKSFQIKNKTTSPIAGERLRYENIFNDRYSPFNRKAKFIASENTTGDVSNLTEVTRTKRNYEINFSELKNENLIGLRIDLGVNSTLPDPEGGNFVESENSDELDDMNDFFFDETGTLIEHFDELNLTANQSHVLYHIMPVPNTVEEQLAGNTTGSDQVSGESQKISDRSSYSYPSYDDDDDEDDQYGDEDEEDDEDYEEEHPKKVKIIKVVQKKWRPRKLSRKRVHHRRQKYKLVPVTVYKKIPIQTMKKHKSGGDVNIHNVNIYENPPPKKIIHHRPEWHFTHRIKKNPTHRHRKPYRPRKRTKFNKIAWLLKHHL